MEGQQRANAAQLATRTIKQPKGRQRKMPLKSNGNVQQSMQFGGSGGLFGGIAPPTSSFDFSAPGGISFPSTSFGNGNTSGNSFSSPDISENEADARVDTTGEELLRRNRGFQPPNDQPALFHTPNTFGGTQSSNPNPFGQPSAQPKPTDNLFSFKPTTSQPPPQPVFNFSSTNTANTQSSPFTFPSSTPKETVPATIGFNSTGAEDNKPANNPFSFLSSQPSSSAPSFSSTAQPGQDKPVNNIFGGIAQPAAPSSVFNFGSPAPQDKPAPSNTPFVFGQSSTKTSSASIDSVPAPAADKPSSNLFGAPQQAPASAGSAFSFGQQPATQPNIFANAKFPPSPASSLFGNQKPVQNTSDIFGGQDQQQNGNGAASTSNGSPPKFGAAEEPVSQSTPPANIFANFGKPATTTSTLFESSNKQTTPAHNLFAGLNGQTTSGSDLFGTLNKPVQQSLAQLDSNRSLANGTDEPKDLTSGTTGSSNLSVFNQAPSSNFNLSSTSLIHTPVPSISASTAGTPAMSFGAANAPSTALAASNYGGETLFSLNKPIDTPKSVLQPAHDVMFPEVSEQDQNLPEAQPTSATVSNGVDSSNAPNVDKSHLYREMAAAARITEEFMRPLVPAKFNEEQRKEFYVAYRMRCLNKAMQGFFTTLAMGSEISKAIGYYQEQRVVIMGDKLDWSSKNGGQTGQDQDSEKSNQNRTTQTQPTKGQVVEKPKMLPDNGSQPFSSDIAPSKLSYPASSGPASLNVAASSSPARGKRKAEVQLTKGDDEREELEGRRMKSPRSVAAPTGGSNTSNIFKNILASPAAASPEKKVETLPATYQDDKPRFNPFSNLPLPSSSAAPNTSATPSAANIFAPKPATETSTLFGSKVSSSASTINTTVSTQAPIKPPTFGTGPVNFMAQFSQQASKSEEKLMEEAKAEDMDSDEDEAEWESRWREKRKSELKTIEALGKSKRATFTGGKFTFGQAEALKTDAPISDSASPEKSDDASQPPSKPLFGLTPGENSTRSMSSSATGSRTPTPGIAGSNTGSVLDGHMSGKPVSFGQNIFGHLSDADSGADSQKDGNHDSDSADEETENEEDSENKDPSYQPGSEQSSSRTSPEDAGQGIIPTKKPLFESGASKSAGHLGATSTSGTSTPGGSLFDRITRDSSGNPIRQISSDEKENTQPSSTTNVANTTNPFARSFDGTQADQTWKPNSPIKFGPPTVNVTAATPTKQATPFANLFGNSGSSEPPSSAGGSPKPTSGLFAGLNTSKPSITGGVGFNFGSGLSTTTSSLFPSAAVSATTSRATSPGGTTDGDSAAEADPDTEHHEQINLTAGGPGEEDEEVLHEVRAKALQWSSTGDTPWQTKGVGPLRVLKHKETGATRILLRADPRGTIVLNKSLLAGVKYEVTEKTIKFPAAGEPGKGLETWLLQLKTPAFAQELGKVMEENKPSS